MQIHYGSAAILTLILSLGAAPALAKTSSWEIDAKQSRVEFTVMRDLRVAANGSFTGISGNIAYDLKGLSNAEVAAQIPLVTMKTGISVRDDDLKSRKYLDVGRFAFATFKSIKIVPGKDGKSLMFGEFQLRGISRKIELKMQAPVIEATKGRGSLLSAVAYGAVDQRDYGLNFKLLHPDGFVRVNDKIGIKVLIKAFSVSSPMH